MSSLREGASTVVRREDYAAPAYWIDTVDLTFDLDPAKTRVLNRMRLRRNTEVAAQPLRLDGEDLNLARVLVNGAGCSFKMDGQVLVLENLPEGGDAFELEIFTTCAPEKNTQLMGLYVSQGTFFTQCEAAGLPPHHLFPRPARCDGQLHRHAARRQGQVPGAAVQRQPGGRRRVARPGQ